MTGRVAQSPTTATADASPATTLRRACACGKSAGPSGSCTDCDSERRFGAPPLQAKANLLQRKPDEQKKKPEPPKSDEEVAKIKEDMGKFNANRSFFRNPPVPLLTPPVSPFAPQPLAPFGNAFALSLGGQPPAPQPFVPFSTAASPPVPPTASTLPPLIDDQRGKSQADEYGEAGGKAAEAFLETKVGTEILGEVGEFFTKTPTRTGLSIGAGVVGVVGLGLARQPLPVPIPSYEIADIPDKVLKVLPGFLREPLSKVPPGWYLHLTYEGPVFQPDKVLLSIGYKDQKPKEKPGPSFADETKRLAEEQARFREGLIYPPGSPEARQKQAEDDAAMQFALSQKGGIDIDAIIAKSRQGQVLPSPGGLQSTPGPLFGPNPLSPFGDQFRLTLPGDPRREEETPGLQKKMSIGASNDPLEAEADRVADQVLAKPAAMGTTAPQIQRLSTQASCHTDAVPESVHRTLAGSGAPLDLGVRHDMEARFGQDFSAVRVHTDAPAARSASDVDALAYTVGSDVVFGTGQYAPGSSGGQRLLAHELTHVVQQGGGPSRPVVQREPVSARKPKMGRRPGSTLPYREATELNKCIQMMGSENAEYCRSEVLAGNFGIAQTTGAAEPATNASPQPASNPAPARTPSVWASTIRDEVTDLLSYGLFDWAVRDKEAVKALALLGGFPEVELPEQLRLIGTKFVRRLLDNLPEESRSDPAYKRIVNVMGSAGVMGFAEDQLSYGLFDWAITDNEAGSVFDALSKLPAAEHESFLADLNKAKKLDRLISNATDAHHKTYIRPWIATLARGKLTDRQKSILRVVVEECGEDDVATIKLAAEARFDVSTNVRPLNKGQAIEWKADSLKRVYQTLEGLPDSHVGRNQEFLHLVQFSEASTGAGNKTQIVGGRYFDGAQTLSINANQGPPSEAGDTPGASGVFDPSPEGIIRHETAHAVGSQIGWKTGAEAPKSSRGGWKRYASGFENAARDMVDDAGGAIKSSIDATQRQDVVREMGLAMLRQNATGLTGKIGQLPWFASFPQNVQAGLLGDTSLEALRAGLMAQYPWSFASGGGVQLGTHIYQEAYRRDWYRYEHAARARLVSTYQFRDSGEWFAEAYAAFYAPDKRGKGAKLNDKDSNTKAYFDTVIDKLGPSR